MKLLSQMYVVNVHFPQYTCYFLFLALSPHILVQLVPRSLDLFDVNIRVFLAQPHSELCSAFFIVIYLL